MNQSWKIALLFVSAWSIPPASPLPVIEEVLPKDFYKAWFGLSRAEIDSHKYFHEPGNHEPGTDDRLGHYDTRYFHGMVSEEERSATLSLMTKAYLTTFRELGLETWIAHGTLLGWWWNGRILPWDWDVDTQVSGATLQYMGEHHNQTSHHYPSSDGTTNRTYFLDVNSWSGQRDPGDGANIIDARWIDTSNGLYIDITGLSEVYPDSKPGIWSCKNYHDYQVQELYPLRESTFEDVPTSIPYAYDQILVDEYRSQALASSFHEGHQWHEDVKEWILVRSQ